jgi:hypothetical protein
VLIKEAKTVLLPGSRSLRGGFGTGPRRKWQTMVRAPDRFGLPSDLLRHGVKREMFLFRRIDNAERVDGWREGAQGENRESMDVLKKPSPAPPPRGACWAKPDGFDGG